MSQNFATIDHIFEVAMASGDADCNTDGKINVTDLICLNDLIAGNTTPSTSNASRVVYFVYDQAGQLIGEYDAQGNPIQEIIYLGNMPIATVKQGNVYYIHTDHLNTPRLITDQTNRPVWSWVSDAFGATAANNDPDGDGEAFEFNLRFPGQYFDEESGAHYNYFRDYNPATGRYVQSDPIGLGGGLNTYGYVEGNPLSYVDPLGLDGIYYPDSYSDPSPGAPGRNESGPPNQPSMQPPGSTYAPWSPPNIPRSESSGCAPYYMVNGGLIPLVSTSETPLSKCSKKVTCNYSGRVATRANFGTDRMFWWTSYAKTVSFTEIDGGCCEE